MKMTPYSMPCLSVRRLRLLPILALLLLSLPLDAQSVYTPWQKGNGKIQPTGDRQAIIQPPKAAGEYAFIQLNELKGKSWSVQAKVILEGVVPTNLPKNAITPIFQLNNKMAEPGKWNYQMALSLDWGQDGKSTPRIALPQGLRRDFQPIQLPQVFHVRVQRKEDQVTIALLKESSEPPLSEVTLPATGDTLYMTWGSLGTDTKHTTFEWRINDLEIKQGEAASPGVTPQPVQNQGGAAEGQPQAEDPRVSKATQQAGGALVLGALALLASLLAIVLTVVTFVLNRGKGAKDSGELPGKITAIETRVNTLNSQMATKQDIQNSREQITKDLTERVQQGFVKLDDRMKAAEAAVQSASSSAPPSSSDGLDYRVQSCEAQLQQIAGQIQNQNSDISNLRATLNTLMDKITLLNRALQQMEQAQRNAQQVQTTAAVSPSTPTANAGTVEPGLEDRYHTTHPATTPAVTIIQSGPSGTPPADNGGTVVSSTPPASSNAPLWETQWRQLRQSLNAHRASVTVESFSKDLDMLETYFKTLIEKWETLKPPAEDAHMWDEWLFSNLDYHLYQAPRLTSLGEVSPEIRGALERMRSVIEQAQEARKAQLREWELERIEGVPGKDRATAYVMEADPENPPEPTTDPRKDYTFSHIVPGRGGYRFRGRVLRKTHAVFYQFKG
jgi:hypothetical protein